MKALERPCSRRAALVLLSALGLAPFSAGATGRPLVTMHRDPSCGCCGGWADHLRAAGFPVNVVETSRLNAIKVKLGVPNDLWSCHTAEIGAYLVEGHVPAAAIEKLLAQKPEAQGLAAPGMPIGSPGMEGGEPETFEVILFGAQGARIFGRYRGEREV